ncbi:MAG: hypothetical protein ABJA98_04775 [Acidobacteriota bacterium]
MRYSDLLEHFARLLLLAFLMMLAVNQAGSGAAGALTAASAPLVGASDLVYQGAFKLPHASIGGSSFDYGGTGLAFNPARDSLFIVGHDWGQQVAEVTVPTIRASHGWSDLPTAAVLQPFTDATEGRMRTVAADPGITVKVGGLLAYRGALYLSAYIYYDGDGRQSLSHFVSGQDLAVKGDVVGPYQVGKLGAGFVSGYFGLVPEEWQKALGGPVLNGQCCLSIISRTSYGPSAFAIDPSKLGTVTPLPAVPLVYYTGTHQLGQYGAQSALFNGSTEMGGVVFPKGRRSVLFFGKQGLGPSCYGEGTKDMALVGTGPPGDPYCYDPVYPSKGEHAFPYAPYVWAYDAADLAAVKSGQRQPWDVKPYAVWSLDLPFPGGPRILGAAYDPQTSRIFLSEAFGDGANPLIHVFGIAN